MDVGSNHGTRGVLGTLATFALCATVYVGFGWATYALTGDFLAFIAGLPIALATTTVVGTWLSFIRLDGVEEQERDTVQAAEPIPHAHIVATQG